MKRRETFSEALNFRHACKLFDADRKIVEKDMRYILEAGRLSPSSFGMEGWKFLVITNSELKQKLRKVCWDQPQITTCSHLVVVLAAINPLKPQSGTPQKRFQRRNMPQEMIQKYIEVYENYVKAIGSDKDIFAWSARQTYIAATNMMMAAAIIGIDSCPIEGFEKEKVDEILKLNTKEFRVSLALPFGYRVNPQPKRIRLDFDEVVEYIN